MAVVDPARSRASNPGSTAGIDRATGSVVVGQERPERRTVREHSSCSVLSRCRRIPSRSLGDTSATSCALLMSVRSASIAYLLPGSLSRSPRSRCMAASSSARRTSRRVRRRRDPLRHGGLTFRGLVVGRPSRLESREPGRARGCRLVARSTEPTSGSIRQDLDAVENVMIRDGVRGRGQPPASVQGDAAIVAASSTVGLDGGKQERRPGKLSARRAAARGRSRRRRCRELGRA